jgi:hypothetical protein
LLEKEDLLVRERVGEFEEPLPPLLDSRLISTDDLQQQLRSKFKDGAVIASFNRMRDAIRFGLIEE